MPETPGTLPQFARCFPEGSVQRFVWDDQIKNNAKAAAGKPKSTYRFHPVTLKWALRRLIKDGASSYEEMRGVQILPSARYLRNFKNAFREDGEGVQHRLLSAMDDDAERRKLDDWGVSEARRVGGGENALWWRSAFLLFFCTKFDHSFSFVVLYVTLVFWLYSNRRRSGIRGRGAFGAAALGRHES